MPVEISRIAARDISAAARCVQLAFEDDPYHDWVFDRTKFDGERNLASLRAKCEWGFRNALFYVARDVDVSSSGGEKSGEVVGVSMWLRPRAEGSKESWSEWWDGYALWFRQGWNALRYLGRGGLRTDRYWVWKRRQAEAQAELWDDPQGY